MPGSRKKRDRRDRLDRLLGTPATLRALCDHLVEGGTLLEWCRTHDVRYSRVAAWIGAEAHRRAKVDTALSLRGEFLSDMVIRNLRLFADVDVGRAYDADGHLLAVHRMPEDVRRVIREFEIDELAVGSGKTRTVIGHTKKIKTIAPEKALELLAKYRKMLTDKVEHSADESLEEILTRSRQPEAPG